MTKLSHKFVIKKAANLLDPDEDFFQKWKWSYVTIEILSLVFFAWIFVTFILDHQEINSIQ